MRRHVVGTFAAVLEIGGLELIRRSVQIEKSKVRLSVRFGAIKF